jgi:hypothetical protein
MDGAFFSTMPFPALDAYSLTHVRYTPHTAWQGETPVGLQPQGERAALMLRDATRYMPCLEHAELRGSLFEHKAILLQSEDSDSRPIVCEESPDSPRILSILGSKIDTIYDAMNVLRQKSWIVP